MVKYAIIIYGLFFLLIGCKPLPEAEFYESKGIVSVNLHHLAESAGWEKVKTSTSVSLTPANHSSLTELAIEFSANSGSYAFWTLSQSIKSESDNLIFRVENEEGDLIAGGRAAVPFGLSREWMSREYTTGDLLTFRIPDRGVYRLILSVGEADEILIDKLHLTRNNEYPPTGFGYPETTDPSEDPVWQRRDLKPLLPPARMFGVVDSASENGGQKENTEYPRNAAFTSVSDLYSAGYVENSLKKLTPADVSGDWEEVNGSQWLETVVEVVANQRLDLYEAPYLAAELNDIHFTEEEWIRWVQFSALNSIMYVPSDAAPELSERGEEIVEFYKNFRAELFPYIYGTSRAARMEGRKPVIGAPFYTDQFMLGGALLVAPVLDSNSVQQVQLPLGKWFDYWDGTEHEGGVQLEIESDLARIPLFVKAGSVIPYAKRGNGEAGLTIEIYGKGTGAGTFLLYEDEGCTENYLQGEFSTVAFRYFEHETYGAFTIGKRVRGYPGQPDAYPMTLRFKHIPEPIAIKANGELLEESVWQFQRDAKELAIEWEQPADQKTDFEIIWSEGG